MADNPGEYQGKHYTEYVDAIKELRQNKQLQEAEDLLMCLLDAVESEARAEGSGVTPGYYEQLAVIYRARRDYVSEVAVLERFAVQKHAPGIMPPQLLARLTKARILANKKCPYEQEKIIGTACFIDVETTGLNIYDDEIIELAMVLFSYNRITGEVLGIENRYTGLREPQKAISRGASKVHGITKKAVKGKQLDNDQIKQFIEKSDCLIAHNANFDREFMCRLFPDVLNKLWYCSMNGIKWRKQGFQSKGLQNLLSDHEIAVDQSHRAGCDAECAVDLLSRTGQNGESYLLQLFKEGPLGFISKPAQKEVSFDGTKEIAASSEKPKGKGCSTSCLTVLLFIAGFIVLLLLLGR